MSAVQSLALWYLPPNIVDKFSMVKKKREIGETLRRICEWKGVTILEANAARIVFICCLRYRPR